MIARKSLDAIMEKALGEGMNPEGFCMLLIHKVLNDVFQDERDDLRTDFLLQGICEREVEALLDEPGHYQSIYLPLNLRWMHAASGMDHQQLTDLFRSKKFIQKYELDMKWLKSEGRKRNSLSASGPIMQQLESFLLSEEDLKWGHHPEFHS